jgi:hypothetical protein
LCRKFFEKVHQQTISGKLYENFGDPTVWKFFPGTSSKKF